MEYPLDLNRILLLSSAEQESTNNDNNNDKSNETLIGKKLKEWNESLESLFLNPSSSSSNDTTTIPSISLIQEISSKVQIGILYHGISYCSSSSSKTSSNASYEAAPAALLSKLSLSDGKSSNQDEMIQAAIQEWKNHDRTTTTTTSTDDDHGLETLIEYVRGGSNLLRWYLQIYQPQQQQHQRQRISQQLAQQQPIEPHLQSQSMLTLYILLIDKNTAATTTSDDTTTNPTPAVLKRQALARYTSLLLFYATYSTHPMGPQGDEPMQKRYQHLLKQSNNFAQLVLQILLRPNYKTTSLLLSLIRNLHNLLVSCPRATKPILSQATVFMSEEGNDWMIINPNNNGNDEDEVSLLWYPKKEEFIQHPFVSKSNDKEDTVSYKIGFLPTLHSILQWSIMDCQHSTKFPGDASNPNDRRSDLVNEIFNLLYALGCGRQIFALEQTTNQPPTSIQQLMVAILCDLSSTSNNNKRSLTCQLSMISLLMEMNNTPHQPQLIQVYGDYFSIQQPKIAFSLLDILQLQVSQVIEAAATKQHDATATAHVIPILAIVHKFSTASSTFRKHTKERIFPPEDEEHFWKLVQEQEKTKHEEEKQQQPPPPPTRIVGGDKLKANNMLPVYAPAPTSSSAAGSLRYNMIRFMTWPESYIKRFSSELLYTVCNNDSYEFVLRVGLGNAVALLHQRGIVRVPNI